MAMNLGSSSGNHDVMVEMNTTPLIDVMLVLLVMLIVTIPIQMHSVKLDLPQNRPQITDPPPAIELGVDFDGTITWNGRAIDFPTLQAYFQQEAAKGDTQDEIHVLPNRLTKYDEVAKIMAAAQRSGVTKIGFVGNEQYMK
ncbi:MAG TPA: biopolymer transporter ExbD [Rhizomicrobium sp.]|nr:biopolymer transporter ExbD [Rhizomicrobium sp.]